MKTYLFAMLVLIGATMALTTSASAQAPPTPVTATRTSVPGHPLQVRFGATPASEQSLALPNTAGLAAYSDAQTMRSQLGVAVPAALPGFYVKSAEGSGRAERFSATVFFAESTGTKTVKVAAWTKTGDFLIAVPANSPVTEVTQTTVGGLSALTLMPTPAVAGGIGPRTVYLTDGRTVWLLEIDGFSDNASAMKLVETVARIVTTPGAPATGTSMNADRSGSPTEALYLVLGAALVVVSAATWLRSRQR